MNDKGYILLSRSILDSDVFASQKLLKIWVWCLCKANFKDRSIPLKIGKGETIVKVKRGSFIFGRFKAEEELFIDGSTVYKSIKKLEEMDMISIKSNNQYSIVTICKYNDYQDYGSYKVTTKEQPSNNQVTSNEQPSNTTNTLPNVNNDNTLYLSEIYKKDLFNSFSMIEAQAKLHSAKIEEIQKHLNNFWLKNYEGKETEKSLNGIRSHFTNWLAKQDIKVYLKPIPHFNQNEG